MKSVIIVGAGPAGLATSACLNLLSVPNLILEKEDCFASLWKHRAYDRLHLHLAKEFCELPHMPYPPTAPTFIPRKDFVRYLDEYVSRFDLKPLCSRSVESATFSQADKAWIVQARNTKTDVMEEYQGSFLVVATGENGEGFIPSIPGLECFTGEVMHSSQYRTGGKYSNKSALVVGCGNSGMEIALDLCNHGAKVSIVVRSPFHVFTRNMIHKAMVLLKQLPCDIVDIITVELGELHYGDLTRYGIQRPSEGPFRLKDKTGRSPVIDVGTIEKIVLGKIKVVPSLKGIREKKVSFSDGQTRNFDVIVFATGYRSTAKRWLKDDDGLMNAKGMPKERFPRHWKGRNGLYCAGFSGKGLSGISMDAENIANDIRKVI
ncbi:probable indole-3-pyruvate monooxygenase YUCCA11 isoform X2 [Aristolochia californica]|uniref:probable indole-3-pyruvate monooxygenase YUCCA11 isoform X2 n=1 Tax=Aristolochia californica TaxID=171875 RepID=UPI0035D95462